MPGLRVSYLRSLAGVWSSLPPLGPPWAVEKTTAMENPGGENTQTQLTSPTMCTHHSQQPSVFARAKWSAFKNERA